MVSFSAAAKMGKLRAMYFTWTSEVAWGIGPQNSLPHVPGHRVRRSFHLLDSCAGRYPQTSHLGEREWYTQLNAEFQRIARRDKKAFLNEQCKEIEEKNRMGKTRDLFMKNGDIKGNFHTRMGTINDWNGENLTEAEGIKKRWQEVFIPIPKKGNAKECSNYCRVALISQASKIMFKIFQARLQQYLNCELIDG